MEIGTKLTLGIDKDTFNYENSSKYMDSDTLVQAFAGLMLAHTYDIDTILDSFKKYIEIQQQKPYED